MGKFASTIKNLINIIGLFLLAHLGYKLYIVAERLLMMYNKIDEMNGVMRSLYEIMRAIGKKFRVPLP